MTPEQRRLYADVAMLIWLCVTLVILVSALLRGHRVRDPAVLTWQIALAPQPRREPTGHHWWRELVMAAYLEAREAWEIRFDLEANQSYVPGVIAHEKRRERRGGRREVTDFIEQNPPPTLGQFMTGLSRGAIAPERIGAPW